MSGFTRLPTEDDAIDVIRKAALGLHSEGLQVKAVHDTTLNALRQQMVTKTCDRAQWFAMADALGLDGKSLFDLACDGTVPAQSLPDGWQQWLLPFGPYQVNAYLLPIGADACLLVDAGFDAGDFLSQLRASARKPVALLITHNHRDHTGALQEFCEQYPEVPVYAMDRNCCQHTEALRDHTQLDIGPYRILAHHTPGHSADGTSFEIRDPSGRPIAIACGDAVYARSTGKIPQNYRASLERLRSRILSQPGPTLLLPGHGPITTVASETESNPFFPTRCA